jgi:hypothetical protein
MIKKSNPSCYQVADQNYDGFDDVVLASAATFSFMIIFSDGLGGFDSLLEVPIITGEKFNTPYTVSLNLKTAVEQKQNFLKSRKLL